jgi:hypothetical protein
MKSWIWDHSGKFASVFWEPPRKELISLQRTWEALKAEGCGFLILRMSEYMSNFIFWKALTISFLISSGDNYLGCRLGCVVHTVDCRVLLFWEVPLLTLLPIDAAESGMTTVLPKQTFVELSFELDLGMVTLGTLGFLVNRDWLIFRLFGYSSSSRQI